VTGTLTITSDGTVSETIVVSGTAISYDGAACDPAATTATVDLIVISGSQPGGVMLDLSGGQFAPGATVEGSGTSEIEFTVSNLHVFAISATTAADAISLGENGINLNADDDVDVTVSDIEFVSVTLWDGSDTLNAAGDSVVGAGFTGGLIASGGFGADSLTGGPTGDLLLGDEDADVLNGRGGQDHLGGGRSTDLLNGGAGPDDLGGDGGRDTTIYADAPAAVSVHLSGKASGGAGADELDSIERVIGSDFADKIVGNDVGNVLEGGGGNDLINGRGGPDELFGEQGRDRVSFAGSRKRVSVNLATDSATGWGDDFILLIEDVTGSAHNDAIKGSIRANHLNGGRGNDRLGGLGGSDVLEGRGGRDRLSPGPGSDRANGGRGADTIDLSASDGAVAINLARGSTTGQGTDRISEIERARGSRFADLIFGNRKANVLDGWRGRDRVHGYAGGDAVVGGQGEDRLFGEAGPDRLIGGADHDVLSGGDGDDRVGGGDGPDLLHGDGGNDTLNGGAGIDTCYQDAGSGPKTSCEKPAPPPASGGGGGGGGGGRCTPGYSPCLPLGPSDYDCYGGGGNGPAYTEPGVVYRVTGSDPYDLDRNNDGFGCE
jgi:Ca2+-binding RTX toxin-like protein